MTLTVEGGFDESATVVAERHLDDDGRGARVLSADDASTVVTLGVDAVAVSAAGDARVELVKASFALK